MGGVELPKNRCEQGSTIWTNEIPCSVVSVLAVEHTQQSRDFHYYGMYHDCIGVMNVSCFVLLFA